MNKGLSALVLGLSTLGFAQEAKVPETPQAEESIPSPREVRDRIVQKGYFGVHAKVGEAFWYTLVLDDLYTFSVFSGIYEMRTKTLTLCSYFRPSGKDATVDPIILSTCVSDKGLDGKIGGCYVGLTTLENTLPQVLQRDLSPSYAFSALQPGDKEYCMRTYPQLRQEMMRAQPGLGVENQK